MNHSDKKSPLCLCSRAVSTASQLVSACLSGSVGQEGQTQLQLSPGRALAMTCVGIALSSVSSESSFVASVSGGVISP